MKKQILDKLTVSIFIGNRYHIKKALLNSRASFGLM